MKKILVIEDEPEIRKLIRRTLRHQNFEVTEAKDGQQGVLLAQSLLPDLILCDIMMPNLNGYEVLKTLRQNPVTETIPFIFLSGKSEKIDWRQGMVLGADDYLTKPFTIQELIEAVSTRFEKQVAIERQSQKKLDELRENIIHSLPHELRTPLNGILGFSQMLLEDYDDIERDQALKILESIHSSGERLYQLIQNYLLYADLELIAMDSEQIKSFCSSNCKISTQTLVTEIALKKATKVNRKADLQLELQEVQVFISETNLYKILEEIIDNAFKFSMAGTPIHISTCQEDNTLKISVSDGGRGMTVEQINNVGAYRQFDRNFYEQQGSGLGLAIAKRLAELHGGKLTIKSLPGEQTTVQITLPVNPSGGASP